MPHFGLTANKKAQSRFDLAIRTRKSVLARKISNGIRIPGQVPTPRHSQRELRLGALKLSCGNATETLVTHPLAGWICAPPIIERERYASFTSQSTVAKRDLSMTASDKACFTSNERRSLGCITATRRTVESSITTEVRR